MKRKPILNEMLFAERVGNKRDEGPLTPVTVTRVGRKYFTCKMGWRGIQFHLDSWRQVTDYSPDCVLYETEQEQSDLREKERLAAMLRQEFNHWGQSPFPLETLRQIRDLVAQAKKQNAQTKT
jgi:hypothetical protein